MRSASDGIIDLYERHAAAWAARRGATLQEKAWIDRWLAGVAPGARILDLGCGSGEPIAAHLIGLGYDVSGVDSSPSLIAICRARFPEARWLVADMRRLELNETFDAIIAWDSFFHLSQEDQRAMFRVFAAHAAPGARLMFTSGPDEGVAIGEFEGDALHHASLSAGEYRRLLSQHDFALAEHRIEDPDCGNHTVWIAQKLG